MLNNKTIAALLRRGLEEDIWYDSSFSNSEEGSEDLDAIIERTQEAMMQAAIILEQLPTN